MKLIKSILFLFLLTFTTHAFAKSNEYYKNTLVHVLTECNSDCQKLVFRQEVDKAFFELMNAVLNQIRFEISMREKESYD
jgi:type III secretory pathway component EscU